MSTKVEEIKLKVSGGFLVATTKSDEGYPGISILFENENGDLVDIVGVEIAEETKDFIKVYNYEDPYTEDVTRTFVISQKEIHQAIYKTTEESYE